MDAIYTVTSNATAWSSQHALPSSVSWAPFVASSIAGYIGLCSALRFRRVRKQQAELNYPDRESLSRMTIEDAQKIVAMTAEIEFPFMYEFSLRLALFKV